MSETTATGTARLRGVEELLLEAAQSCGGSDAFDSWEEYEAHLVKTFAPFVARALEQGRAQAPAPDRARIDSIVAGLFVNGAGCKAHRLVLTDKHGRDLGGWCQAAIVDRIADALSTSVPIDGQVTAKGVGRCTPTCRWPICSQKCNRRARRRNGSGIGAASSRLLTLCMERSPPDDRQHQGADRNGGLSMRMRRFLRLASRQADMQPLRDVRHDGRAVLRRATRRRLVQASDWAWR